MIGGDHTENGAYFLLSKYDCGSMCDNSCINGMIHVILIIERHKHGCSHTGCVASCSRRRMLCFASTFRSTSSFHEFLSHAYLIFNSASQIYKVKQRAHLQLFACFLLLSAQIFHRLTQNFLFSQLLPLHQGFHCLELLHPHPPHPNLTWTEHGNQPLQ